MAANKWDVVHVARLFDASQVHSAPTERRRVGLVSHDDMVLHAPLPQDVQPWDAERPERLSSAMGELRDSGLAALCVSLAPRQATRDDLLLGTQA